MNSKLLIAGLVIQAVAFTMFSYQFIGSVFGISSIDLSWTAHEIIEVVSILGLLVGTVLTLIVLRQQIGQTRKVEEQLLLASKSFHDQMLAQFDAWNLTPAEQENAILIVKGFSIAEISKLRKKSEGTIKAQNSSIYAKSDLAGRAQFVSYFLEGLTADL